jgi:signal transduction histidine kinase/ActR/RegA family two-component response regulator
MNTDSSSPGWNSLRWRLPLLVTLPVVAVMVLGAIAAHSLNVHHWAEIERNDARRTVHILTDTINERLGQLTATLNDDAQWDAAHAFLLGNNPGFTNSDLTQTSLDKLDLAVLMMVDTAGNPRLAWGRDRQGQSTAPSASTMPGGPLYHLIRDAVTGTGKHQGLIWYDGSAALFTATPVTPTDGKGSPSGAIAFIARLDQPQLDLLAKRIEANAITIALPEADGQTGDERIDIADDHLHVARLLPRLDDGEVEFRLNLPRHYMEGVRLTTTIVISAILGGGLATALLIAWLIHRFLARRIVALVQASRDWSAGHMAMTPPLAGDELDGLARTLHAQFHTISDTCAALDQACRQAEAADRAKSMFLAAMSHDIRTPLNGMLGMAQLMQRESLPPTQRERLDTLIRSGSLLLTLLNDLLDVAKIEAGRIELEPVPCVLANEINDIADLLRPNLKPDVTLVVAITPAVPAHLLLDVNRFRQVLWNIAGNAAKFTSRGLIRIATDAIPAGDGHHQLTISVIDSGPGITAEERQRLFQPFSQAAAGRRSGGTGLGLWISQRLAAMMGGDVVATDAPGGGSIFTITLQAMEPPPGTTSIGRNSVPSSTATVAVPHRGLRVLVCDDDIVNQAVIHGMLTHFGESTILTGTGADALRCAAQNTFDLILLDYRLPDLDGLDVTLRMRAAEAGSNRRTPIIGLTADVLNEDRQRLLEAGMDLILTKPVTMPALAEALVRFGDAKADKA